MANTILRLDHEKKALHVFGFLCLSLFMHRTDARDFKVGVRARGGADGSQCSGVHKWAERNRFQIGDSLLFVYTPEKDSVLLVSQEDYKNCNTAMPIATFNDGHTPFRFNSSGVYHFISGIGENCEKSEKLAVVVMANRSEKAPEASPPTSTPPEASPPAPPTASPPTSTPPEASPPAPPAASPPTPESSLGPSASTPSSAPVGTESPSHNGAGFMVVNFMVSFGALLGTSLLFVV